MRAHQTLNSTSANYGPTNPDNPLIIHKPQLSYHDWLVNTLENDRDPQIWNIFLLMLIQPTKQIKVSLCILMLLKIR